MYILINYSYKYFLIFSLKLFPIYIFFKLKLILMVRSMRSGTELKVLEEEREYVLVNGRKIYISDPTSGQFEFKL